MHKQRARPSTRRIIVVENDRDLLENMIKYLTLSGYEVTAAASAREFYHHLAQQTYLLAVLDIELPDQDGMVLAEYARKNTSMWIIMLTAHSTLNDRLAWLKSGADFYLVKPVDCSELAATIANLFARLDELPALFQRKEESVTQAVTRWIVESNKWILITPKGDSIQLTSKEYEFLATLDSPKKTIRARKDILKILNYPPTVQASHALESMISRLRKKIEKAGCDFPVKTSHGTGYYLSSDLIQI